MFIETLWVKSLGAIEGGSKAAIPNQTHFRVLILGIGPGRSYCRYLRCPCRIFSPCLVHGPLPGGQLTTTTEVGKLSGLPRWHPGPRVDEENGVAGGEFAGPNSLVENVAQGRTAISPFTLRAGSGLHQDVSSSPRALLQALGITRREGADGLRSFDLCNVRRRLLQKQADRRHRRG